VTGTLLSADDPRIAHLLDRAPCPYRVERPHAPVGWSVEAQRGHQTYRYYLEDYGGCELREGHSGPHRAGAIIWHDPKLVVVGGVALA